jgi:hypothetical protein
VYIRITRKRCFYRSEVAIGAYSFCNAGCESVVGRLGRTSFGVWSVLTLCPFNLVWGAIYLYSATLLLVSNVNIVLIAVYFELKIFHSINFIPSTLIIVHRVISYFDGILCDWVFDVDHNFRTPCEYSRDTLWIVIIADSDLLLVSYM